MAGGLVAGVVTGGALVPGAFVAGGLSLLESPPLTSTKTSTARATTATTITPITMPAEEFWEVLIDTGATGAGAGAASSGADGRISLPGTGGMLTRAASIGIVIVWPLRLTASVHAVPFQYRPSPGEIGSWYQPAANSMSDISSL